MSTNTIAPLDLIFPRPVLVMLGGTPFKAGELTLGDLATLQSWLRQAAGHPLDGLPPAPLDPEPETRKARLLRRWEEAKRFPPRLDEASLAPAYFASPEGRAVFLVLCLGKWDDGFTAEDARALDAKMDADDWARLRRVAYRIEPWQELAAELDPAWLVARHRGAEDGTDWGETVVAIMKAGHYGFAEIESWTPTQLRLFCGDGKLTGYRAVMKPRESRQEFARRMIETFSPMPPASGLISGDDAGSPA